jgi:hypothetical protein
MVVGAQELIYSESFDPGRIHCRIAERCRRRVMLTGTPLQNDLEELQNLLRFLMPKLFTSEEAAEIANVQVYFSALFSAFWANAQRSFVERFMCLNK